MGNFRIVSVAVIAITMAVAADVGAQNRVFSPDSSVSLRLPASFIPAPLNDQAILQFADTSSEAYVLIILEGRADLVGWNLTRHSMVTAGQIVGMLDMPEVVGPRADQVGTLRAVQYELRGAMQGLGVAYLNTSLESQHAFAQVLVWTLGSQWKANEEMLRELTSSVQLHAAPGSVPYDIRALANNTWAWDRGASPCTGLTQRFEIAGDGKSMKIHHSEPIQSANGTMTSVTDYVIESFTNSTLNTYIPGETRLDDSGAPVKWDLVLIGRNRIAWHRADWPEGAMTGMLRPCPT